MQVNRERMLDLARGNFCTVSELADEIYRSRGLAYRTAHAIAAHTVNEAVRNKLLATDITSQMVDEAAVKVIDKPLELPDKAVRESLDPVTFVARRTHVGGPAPKEVRRMIDVRRKRLNEAVARQGARKGNLEKAESALKRSVAELMK
jgi:argininosuccinate lyase